MDSLWQLVLERMTKSSAPYRATQVLVDSKCSYPALYNMNNEAALVFKDFIFGSLVRVRNSYAYT